MDLVFFGIDDIDGVHVPDSLQVIHPLNPTVQPELAKLAIVRMVVDDDDVSGPSFPLLRLWTWGAGSGPLCAPAPILWFFSGIRCCNFRRIDSVQIAGIVLGDQAHGVLADHFRPHGVLADLRQNG